MFTKIPHYKWDTKKLKLENTEKSKESKNSSKAHCIWDGESGGSLRNVSSVAAGKTERAGEVGSKLPTHKCIALTGRQPCLPWKQL